MGMIPVNDGSKISRNGRYGRYSLYSSRDYIQYNLKRNTGRNEDKSKLLIKNQE